MHLVFITPISIGLQGLRNIMVAMLLRVLLLMLLEEVVVLLEVLKGLAVLGIVRHLHVVLCLLMHYLLLLDVRLLMIVVLLLHCIVHVMLLLHVLLVHVRGWYHMLLVFGLIWIYDWQRFAIFRLRRGVWATSGQHRVGRERLLGCWGIRIGIGHSTHHLLVVYVVSSCEGLLLLALPAHVEGVHRRLRWVCGLVRIGITHRGVLGLCELGILEGILEEAVLRVHTVGSRWVTRHERLRGGVQCGKTLLLLLLQLLLLRCRRGRLSSLRYIECRL